MRPETTITRAAVQAVLSGRATISEVAREFDIAASTLRRALRRHGAVPRTPGMYPERRIALAAAADRAAIEGNKR